MLAATECECDTWRQLSKRRFRLKRLANRLGRLMVWISVAIFFFYSFNYALDHDPVTLHIKRIEEAKASQTMSAEAVRWEEK